MRPILLVPIIFIAALAIAGSTGHHAVMRVAPDAMDLGGGHYLTIAPEYGGGREVVIPQMPGWPKTVITHDLFGETCGFLLVDIDGDPDLEIVAGTSNAQLHAWDYDGANIFSVSLTGLAQTVPAVGDVIGDGRPEIIVTTRDATGGSPTPTIHIFSGNGTLLDSAAMPHTGSLDLPPALANLDADSKLEIIITERGSSTGWVHALDGDLTPMGGSWPVTLDHVPATNASVGDIDNDGQPEIALCSYESVYAIEADGSLITGFPVTFAGETFSYGSPALADLDGDGKLEILTTTHMTYNRVHATQYDGAELAGWPYDMPNWSYAPPSVGDIDGNGDLEVVAGCSGGPVPGYNLYVINHDGTNFGNFPFLMEGGAEGSYVLADLTGDNRLEIIFTNNMMAKGNGYLFAVDADAELLEGWPLRPQGFTYLNGATLGDVNGDGVPEIGVLGVNGATASINLYSYDGYDYGDGGVHWRTYRANNRHSGLYHPTYPGDDDTGDDDSANGGTDDDTGDDDSADDDSAPNDDIGPDDDIGDDDTLSDDDVNVDDDDDEDDGCGW